MDSSLLLIPLLIIGAVVRCYEMHCDDRNEFIYAYAYHCHCGDPAGMCCNLYRAETGLRRGTHGQGT